MYGFPAHVLHFHATKVQLIWISYEISNVVSSSLE